MAVAGCINAYDCAGCYLTTLQQLQSDNIGVAINYTAPWEYWRRQLDYIKYTDKCGCTCCLTGENELRIVATQWVIKNFTLTNDDINEAVIVKWTDLFWSNRAKTVVRYKTWSYPSSPTDWTLAVEETTQNQYQTNWYSVSWLTDWTTYYFTAFAVAQDNTVIVVQNKNITTDFWRKPWVNTYIYYPFSSNLVDVQWNWNTWTIHWSVSFSEQTWITVNWWSWYVTWLTNWIANKNTFTQIFWAKRDWKIDNYWMLLWDSSNYNTNSAFSFELWWSGSNYFRNYQFIWNDSGTSMPNENYDTNWHLRIVVANNWVYNTYKDAVLRWTPYKNWTINNKPNMNIWWSSYYTSWREAKWKIKDYIVELIPRSESDIVKYYNKTKSIFWY